MTSKFDKQFSKFDKPYINVIKPDENKIKDIIQYALEMDTQSLLQYSLINKVPLAIVIDSNGNNLINQTILNTNKIKSEFNRLNFIKFLVQNQVNPDQPNKDNQTPLHLACQFQYQEIVKYLVSLNVNTNYQDNFGYTPLHYLLTGNITIYNEKPIKEFVVASNNKNDRKEELLDLKKDLWNELYTNYEPFFKTLDKNINQSIKENDKINKETLLFQKEILKTGNDSVLINQKVLNFKKTLSDLAQEKWHNFPNSDDIELHEADTYSLTIDKNIGVIKNANIKKSVKDKLKNTMDDINNQIVNYNFKLNFDNDPFQFFDDDIKKIIQELVRTGRGPANFENLLNTYYRKHLHDKAKDFADNIIDEDDLSYVGGSRKVTIIETNYDLHLRELNNLNTIQEKIIYILTRSEDLSIDKVKKLAKDLFNDFKQTGGGLNPNAQPFIPNQGAQPAAQSRSPPRGGPGSPPRGGPGSPLRRGPGSPLRRGPGSPLRRGPGSPLRRGPGSPPRGGPGSPPRGGPGSPLRRGPGSPPRGAPGSAPPAPLGTVPSAPPAPLGTVPSAPPAPLGTVPPAPPGTVPPAPPGPPPSIRCINSNKAEYDRLIKELYELIFITKPKNVGSIVYHKFVKFFTNCSPTRLNCEIHKIFFRLISALINDPVNLGSSLIQTLKIDEFNNYQINNNLDGWIQFLFDNNTLVRPSDPKVLLNYYNDMTFKFPKIYLIDLIYYLSKNNIKDTKPPSTQGNIFINIDVKNDNNNAIHKPFYDAKFEEAKYLGLQYHGCLPHLKYPDSRGKFRLRNGFTFNPRPSNDQNVPNNDFFLPFNYYTNSRIINIPNMDYYKYKDGQYRPPVIESLQIMYYRYLNALNEDLENNLNKTNTIVRELLSISRKVSDVYIKYLFEVNLITNRQKAILARSKIKDVELFDFNTFSTKINNINFYIFMYYYLFKPDRIINLPEFIYSKLIIYNDPYNEVNREIVQSGGAINLTNLDFLDEFFTGLLDINNNVFLYDKLESLPPSLFNNLHEYYELNKKKFIVEILQKIKDNEKIKIFSVKINLKEDDKQNFIYISVAKLIEEIIKNYAEYALNTAIINIINNLSNVPITKLVNKPFEINIVLKDTVNKLLKIQDNITNTNREFLLNFNKISDPNVSSKCSFIIYPNDYTTLNLLNQKYCIEINKDILVSLLKGDAQPLLLDNDGNTCISNTIKIFNYKIIEEIINNGVELNQFDFIKNELKNHTEKMYKNNYKESLENFTKVQFEDIKMKILSDESTGNNVLYNLKNSFMMCFYLMNEYLTDYLWRFDKDYTDEDFTNIMILLDMNKNNIKYNYLNDVCNENSTKLPDSDTSLIRREFLDLFKNKKIEINNYIDRLNNEKMNLDLIKLSSKKIDDKISKAEKDKNEINKKIDEFSKITEEKYINVILPQKEEIILTYNRLTDKGKGVYSEMWDLLFNNYNLDKSYNLSLLKILNLQKDENMLIIGKYFEHLSELAVSYFENPKFINKKDNKVLTYINDILVHLTKNILCFGIESMTRKIIINHLMNIYPTYEIKDLNGITDRLFSDNFKNMLYNELPELFVKNSVPIFENMEEKTSFIPKTAAEFLEELFLNLQNTEESTIIDNVILSALNKNITNYFEMITYNTIINWYVVCENTLKFVINHHRIIQSQLLFMDKNKLSKPIKLITVEPAIVEPVTPTPVTPTSTPLKPLTVESEPPKPELFEIINSISDINKNIRKRQRLINILSIP
jgi:hypothetical protein